MDNGGETIPCQKILKAPSLLAGETFLPLAPQFSSLDIAFWEPPS